jgi:predicted transposase YbfD/YdcC
VRHPLANVLALALGAVAAGARSLAATGEWAQDVGGEVLEQVGLEGPAPSESTLRRVLQALDPQAVSALFGAWARARWSETGGQKVIALDGKTVRGAKGGPDGAPRLVAALTHGAGMVIGQVQVGAKTNEIPAARELLRLLDLRGVVVTMDALHTQTETAELILERGGHYVFTVKDNQPTLKTFLAGLDWRRPPRHRHTEHGHGRTVTREVQALPAPDWIGFPGAAQVLKLRRRVTQKAGATIETVYLICSLPPDRTPPTAVAEQVQGHWAIETRLHWVRDVTFDEDRSQVRTGNGPTAMAVLRNIAITVLRILGWANIAAATRHHQRDHHRIGNLLLTN